MLSGFLFWYLIVSVIVAAADLIIGIKALMKKDNKGKTLAAVAFLAMIVDISYFASIISHDRTIVSVMSSIYFACIDWMLVMLIRFISKYIGWAANKVTKIFIALTTAVCVIDSIAFAINPFMEISIGYAYRDTAFAFYAYEMHPLYYLHLVFSYFMVVAVIVILIHRARSVARQYRKQFVYIIFGILLIVAINAIFLMPSGGSVVSLIDVSICGYSIVLFFIYWTCYNYTKNNLLKDLSMTIFDNVDQGIVLFDYDEVMVLHNNRSEELLGANSFVADMKLDKFLARLEISESEIADVDNYSTQCKTFENGRELQRRCDFRRLKDSKDKIVGNLFVFTDASLAIDPLTGFLTWEKVKQRIEEKPDFYSKICQVVVADINGLSIINDNYGTITGNRRIKELADLMKTYLPQGVFFVRGQDAHLIAFSQYSDQSLQFGMDHVKQIFQGDMQYAVGFVGRDGKDVIETLQTASRAMRVKKLQDNDAVHSQALTSLVRALEECDSDTEAHVKRTRSMGAALGSRIGLTDCQQTDLALLCLLHDIGKIGVPLEILNKPGKLTDEEFAVLKNHSEKGYQIAMSSNELSGIADMIRHHHERWDGHGYPAGLKENEIPLLSRIISVVDAYDAMISDRSYRKSIGVENAIAELEKCAGTQFDPDIVKEFIAMIRSNPDMMVENKKDNSREPDERRTVVVDKKAGRAAATVAHAVNHSRYILDESDCIISVDDNFEMVTGYSKEEALGGMTQLDLIPEDGRTDYLMMIQEMLAKTDLIYLEHKLLKKDGSIVYVFCQGKRYFDSAAQAGRSEIIIADSSDTYVMTSLKEIENSKAREHFEDWEIGTRRDELTKLLKYDSFTKDANKVIESGNNKMMMLVMDVDHFKEFNNIYGQLAGNEFLVFISESLKKSLRRNDIACRVKNDRFAVLMIFAKEHSDSIMIERASQIFDKLNLLMKSSIGGTSLSMGVAISDGDNASCEMYDRAMKALGEARNRGRSCFAVEKEGR